MKKLLYSECIFLMHDVQTELGILIVHKCAQARRGRRLKLRDAWNLNCNSPALCASMSLLAACIERTHRWGVWRGRTGMSTPHGESANASCDVAKEPIIGLGGQKRWRHFRNVFSIFLGTAENVHFVFWCLPHLSARRSRTRWRSRARRWGTRWIQRCARYEHITATATHRGQGKAYAIATSRLDKAILFLSESLELLESCVLVE